MKGWVLIIILLTSLASGGEPPMVPPGTVEPAVPPEWVNYDLDSIVWTWEQGTGPAATEFRFRCGEESGVFLFESKPLPPESRQVRVNEVVPSQGKYYCNLFAKNAVQESQPSNQLFFVAGAGIAAPGNVSFWKAP